LTSHQFYKNISGSTVYFDANVTPSTISTLILFIRDQIENSPYPTGNPVKLTLYIDSPGGSLVDALKFLDVVRSLRESKRLHLTTIIRGFAASAAILMAVVGDVRYITENSTTMLQLFKNNTDNVSEMTSNKKRMNHLHDIIIKTLKNNTNINETGLETLLLNETWYSAAEYVETGFANEVI
jgi:ATP-dependent protease ClpP protease subunit